MLSQSWQLTLGIAITAFVIGGLSSVKFTPTLKKANRSNAQIPWSRDDRSRSGSFSQMGPTVTRRANNWASQFIQKANSRFPPGYNPTVDTRGTNYDYPSLRQFTEPDVRRNPSRKARRELPYNPEYYR
jgi:hypothetical protein